MNRSERAELLLEIRRLKKVLRDRDIPDGVVYSKVGALRRLMAIQSQLRAELVQAEQRERVRRMLEKDA